MSSRQSSAPLHGRCGSAPDICRLHLRPAARWTDPDVRCNVAPFPVPIPLGTDRWETPFHQSPPVTDLMPLQLLIVGQTDRLEASALMEWMVQSLHPADIRRSATLESALEQFSADDWIPDLIVMIQSWPDEVTRPEIDRLSRFAPLARWVVCYGVWCEGDGRTRDLWPLAVRVPLWSAPSRLMHEWRLLCGESVPPLPMSASREEAFSVDYPELRGRAVAGSSTVGAGASSVIVRSPDSAYQHSLWQLLTEAGHAIASDANAVDAIVVGVNSEHGRPSENPPPRVWLLDVDPWTEQRRAEVLELTNRFPDDRFVGLMSLPDPEATTALLELGLVKVLPKLGDQQRICDAIAQAAEPSLRTVPKK